MNKYRRKAAYDIFVRQFLQVGRKCLEFENHKFVPMYVRQARRLADLLLEDHFEIDANDLQELIRELEVLQKHPDVKRSQSNVKANDSKIKSKPPLKKIEIWRPPANEPSTPEQVISPVSFYPMSPDFGDKRKSILKNGQSSSRSPTKVNMAPPNHQTNILSIKADIHRAASNDTISAKAAPPSPISRSQPMLSSRPITFFNRKAITNGDGDGDDNSRDYKKITTIELIDKDGNHSITSQLVLEGPQDSHVSIL